MAAALKKVILNFLTSSHRPHSANEVAAKSGSQDVGHKAVQSVLEALVADEKVVAKSFGKQRIYFIKQQIGGDRKECKRELDACAQRLKQRRAAAIELRQQCDALEAKLHAAAQVRSAADLEAERESLLDAIRELNEQVRRAEAERAAKAAAGQLPKEFTPADVKRIDRNYERAVVAYRQRKRICGDICDAILEGYPKTRRELIDDIGIETDEKANFAVEITS